MAVKFSRLTRSKGRHGIFNTSGLDVLDCVDWKEKHVIVFEPITGKGQPSQACNIEVPKEDLPKLIEELQKLL